MQKLYQKEKVLGEKVKHFKFVNKQFRFNYASLDVLLNDDTDFSEWDYLDDLELPSFNWTDVYEDYIYTHAGCNEIPESEYIKEVDEFNKRMREIYKEYLKRNKK